MKYVTIWQLIGNAWVIERTHSEDYAKSLLNNVSESKIFTAESGRKYAYFKDGINPNEMERKKIDNKIERLMEDAYFLQENTINENDHLIARIDKKISALKRKKAALNS